MARISSTMSRNRTPITDEKLLTKHYAEIEAQSFTDRKAFRAAMRRWCEDHSLDHAVKANQPYELAMPTEKDGRVHHVYLGEIQFTKGKNGANGTTSLKVYQVAKGTK